MSEKKPLVPCPQCGKEVVFDISLNPFRPFCSERCKLIDLGQWANGNYSIPVKDSAPQILLDPDNTHQS